MQDRDSSARIIFETIQNVLASTSAVNRHDPTSRPGAGCERVTEDCELVLPVRTKLGPTVEPDLTHITRTRHKLVEQRQLGLPLVGELRMQAQRRACSLRRKTAGTVPSAGRSRDGQDIVPTLAALVGNAMSLRIQVQVTMDVDHVTPAALRNAASSSSPRPTIPL